jgi:type I restriction enzyme S subunit
MSKGYSLKPSSEHTTSHLDFLQIDVLPVGHHWQKVRIGEIGEVVGGSTPSTKIDEYWNGEIPWLTPSEVSHEHNLFLSKTERYLTRAGLESTSLRLLPPGTVMMTSRATIGAVGINIVPMATNQGFINIICDPEKVDNVFLAYWIRYHRPEIEARAKGTTFKEISRSSFKSMELLLPPLHEQRAIARVLRAVQEVMQALRRELELERERKAALMHHLFRYGTRGEPTRQTEIGEIPQSWEVASLGTFLTDPPQYGLSTPGNQKGQYPILRMNNLSDGKINFLDLQYVDLKEDIFNRFKLCKDDILFNRTNSYELIGKNSHF